MASLEICHLPILKLGVVQNDTNAVAIGVAPIFRLVVITPSAPPPVAGYSYSDGLVSIQVAG